MTKKETFRLANDIHDNKVFITLGMEKEIGDLLPSIFMPLTFMGEEHRKELMDSKPVCLYEYYDKAMNRGINGYPIFTTFKWLNQEQAAEIIAILQKLDEVHNSLEKLYAPEEPEELEPVNEDDHEQTAL